MKPRFENLKALCPDVDPRLVEEHLSRLNERYFERFCEDDIREHLEGLSRLCPEHPVDLHIRETGHHQVDFTVLGFDYLGVFSLMTGILAGMGFNISSGDVFTYRLRKETSGLPGLHRGRTQSRRKKDALSRRRIVNHFSGSWTREFRFKEWAAELEKRICAIFVLLEKQDSPSAEQARHQVNETVAKELDHFQPDPSPALSPVLIEVDNESGEYTRLKIVSEDTPAFLYSLTQAFSLHGISIEHIQIRTRKGQISDEIDVVDAKGGKIEDPDALSRIKLSVLLTKQFTYFLGQAPDRYSALLRFKNLVQDILDLPAPDRWLETLSDPHALRDLALLLGTSDFLWEDFIRLHYETLLPMLQPIVKGQRFSLPEETLTERLEETLRGAVDLEDKRDRLNAFKDREIFHIDLDHILNPGTDFRAVANRLTRLAEIVVRTATEFCCDHLVARYGRPRTAVHMEAEAAIFGLGKLGGAALGYASDIEFLLVYGDNGMTDGGEPIANSEFFNRLVQWTAQSIRAKREGIFQVDLRLRPHGSAGPLACSLESFCEYYGPGGPAHAYERLALVRMRAFGGSPALGARLERIRDEMIYGARSIDLQALRELREKQFHEKTEKGRQNAKFSPGGLVDLEYNVQILQVLHGNTHPRLKTPELHLALAALSDAGVLAPEETGQLLDAYAFLRLLINAMRMLRGSAQDLFLPPADSLESAHLARRMGYREARPLGPAQQLRIDYETHTAVIRAFAERYFGRTSLPGPVTGTVADLVLADSVPEELSRQILERVGFRNPRRAYTNLRGLAGKGSRRHTFAKLTLLAVDVLSQTPDPDMALNNWERFIHVRTSPEFHYNLLLSQPMRLEILLNIFAGSQFLSDTLVRYPGFLDWVILPENLHGIRKRADIEAELEGSLSRAESHEKWMNNLRRTWRREMLRIGARDMALGVPTQEVMLDLTTLAEALVRMALRKVLEEIREAGGIPEGVGNLQEHFCILAFGKLGGQELNYSSDIDLVGVFDASGGQAARGGSDPEALKELYAGVMERVGLDLSRHTEAGYAYRVDLRLRPHGQAGDLVPSFSGLMGYYRREASLWEIQAALKIRPIAGDPGLGERFLEEMRCILLERRDTEKIVRSIEGMRQASVTKIARSLGGGQDVKNGEGGIRDVEFLVQGLQLIHGPDRPELLTGNTLEALQALEEARLLPETVRAQLAEDYLLLRRVEHFLQILEGLQTHALPKDPAERKALARRLFGREGDETRLAEELEACMLRVRKAYTTHLLEITSEGLQ
jgi:glutamate-ammonia-ligase adenylyltransferase